MCAVPKGNVRTGQGRVPRGPQSAPKKTHTHTHTHTHKKEWKQEEEADEQNKEGKAKYTCPGQGPEP